MSIQFSPKNQPTTSSSEMQPLPKPKLSLLQKWIDSIYDGCLKESLHPKTYCERAWIQQTNTFPSQTTQLFMQTCMDDCMAYKSYCRWSRLN